MKEIIINLYLIMVRIYCAAFIYGRIKPILFNWLLATDEASSVAFCFGGVCKFERHRKAKPNFSQRYTKDYN